ncbi:GNAT family N-acetyltransferase [Actinomadura sp. ATCC 31491]|uniref:GNAT family N-acetyltransferase n=1 Tax=Actinomadura luzonensis TaxID=2805427 RepID=A0ABT0FU27_9ACTN|nr:GNAT family N-acetyltransferase [Actinomadura luzonensis]MCK2215490.1 GNAT family N-acetyltransferase [Actinomadura luzonensis]
MHIRPGTPGDIPAVLAMFDSAVAWLAAHGRTGQWGERPFTGDPRRTAQVSAWAHGGGMHIAERPADPAPADPAPADPAPAGPSAQPSADPGTGTAPGGHTTGGVPAGCIVLGDAHDYVTPATEPELYVQALVTGRRHAGHDVGRTLLAFAADQARERGLHLLRVDCYAGGDGRLVAYYESCGFTRQAPFTVGEWPGMLLHRRL